MAGEVARLAGPPGTRGLGEDGPGLLEIVATTEHLLEGTEPAIRGRETALGDFLCDTLRARFGADVALVNGGAIRVNDDVPAGGDLRVYELEGIFYYDDKPVIIEIAGRDLVASCWRTRSRRPSSATAASCRCRAYGSGITSARRPADDRSGRCLCGRRRDQFTPIDLDRSYRVATLTTSGRTATATAIRSSRSATAATSPRLLESPEISWRALTEEAIAALPNRRITTNVDGRIERAD